MNEFYMRYDSTSGFSWTVADRKKVEAHGIGNYLDALDLVAEMDESTVTVLAIENDDFFDGECTDDDGVWKIFIRSRIPHLISVAELARQIGNYDGGGGHAHSAQTRWHGNPTEAIEHIRILAGKILAPIPT